MKKRILIVDDEKNIRRTLGMILRAEEYEVDEAASGEEALQKIREQLHDLVLLDVRLPGMDGVATLREVRKIRPDAMVIMISGHASVETAVEATRGGAFDFLEKPLSKERVLVAIRNAFRFVSIGHEVKELKARDATRYLMLGESEAMKRIRDGIEQAGPTSARILVLGESGTGKELVARAIHEASGRADKPFVKVNCAAIPEELIESELFGSVKGAFTGSVATRSGKFLQADGGTLFLDEVGDMSARAQAKVLRALQEGEIEKVGGSETIRVDVRVIAATNKDLKGLAAEGGFREDLYFRLAVFPFEVPPLRERSADIPLLANHFLETYRLENNRQPVAFSPAALELLSALSWPGNVRELNNVVERLLIMSRGSEIGVKEIRAAGLGGREGTGEAARSADNADCLRPLSSGKILSMGGLVEARRRFEAACITEALRGARGNVSEAARLLGIDRTNLHKKIQSYDINLENEDEA